MVARIGVGDSAQWSYSIGRPSLRCGSVYFGLVDQPLVECMVPAVGPHGWGKDRVAALDTGMRAMPADGSARLPAHQHAPWPEPVTAWARYGARCRAPATDFIEPVRVDRDTVEFVLRGPPVEVVRTHVRTIPSGLVDVVVRRKLELDAVRCGFQSVQDT